MLGHDLARRDLRRDRRRDPRRRRRFVRRRRRRLHLPHRRRRLGRQLDGRVGRRHGYATAAPSLRRRRSGMLRRQLVQRRPRVSERNVSSASASTTVRRRRSGMLRRFVQRGARMSGRHVSSASASTALRRRRSGMLRGLCVQPGPRLQRRRVHRVRRPLPTLLRRQRLRRRDDLHRWNLSLLLRALQEPNGLPSSGRHLRLHLSVLELLRRGRSRRAERRDVGQLRALIRLSR